MPRKYKRTLGSRPYRNYSSENLEECLRAIRSKEITQRAAEKKFGIPRATIKNKLAGKHSKARGGCTAFTAGEELTYKEHLVRLSDFGFPDPFDIRRKEETRIKEEIFETEEFNEMKQEEIMLEEGSTQDNVNFETIYCTSGTIEDEHQDDLETPNIYNATETDPIAPEFMNTVIKTEPPVKDESTSVDPVSRHSSVMFGAELEMYQHLNLNHVVKGRASKKASGPRSVIPTVISPSTTPSVAISSADGLVFFTSTSSPRVSPVDVSKISVPVTTSQSVPSSSSGPVTVTTTFSYSSTTTSSAPLVTSVSGSSVSSVSSAPLILSASPSTTVRPTPAVSPSVGVTSSTIHSPNALPDTTASQRLKNRIVSPISNQSTGSTNPKSLLLAPQKPQSASATKTSQLQPQKISATKTSKPQPFQIFQPSKRITVLPFCVCATDDSEMFSISLAQFPLNRRVPIKQKLVDVVSLFKQKNISPDKVLILYCKNSPNSRTV